MNEVKKHFTLFIIGLIIGCLVTGAVTCGYYIHKSKSDRELCGQLRKQLDESTAEVVRIRASFEECRTELSEYLAEISRIREELGECRKPVEDAVADCGIIRDSVQQIRKQVEVLQNYYNRVNNLYDSIPCYDSDSNKTEEINESNQP